MKWFIMSDIHGSAYWCEQALMRCDAEKCDRILLLGDILYHGPRNDLPRDYNPKRVIGLLNERKNSLLCVRGNCEAEVDQMVFDFPVMADYAIIQIQDRLIYATHGHKYGKQNPLPLSRGDAVLSGHTHIPDCCEINGLYYFNPGSVSLPKGESENSYMVFDGKTFEWKNMSGKCFMSFIFDRPVD